MVGADARQQTRAEAGSTCLADLFVSCRVDNPCSHVARVNSALHNLCVSLRALPSLHIIHRRFGTSLLCTWENKGVECGYSAWGQALCCGEACFSTADAFKVA